MRLLLLWRPEAEEIGCHRPLSLARAQESERVSEEPERSAARRPEAEEIHALGCTSVQ